jgi:hypothetical protein
MSLRWPVGAVIVSFAGVLAGCAPAPGGAVDQRGGPAIAAEIRRGDRDIVRHVGYTPGDLLDAARIDVQLRGTATAAEIQEFVCEVVIPALRTGDPPQDLGVFLSNGHVILANAQPCDATTG